ncbi:MAG: hypothetical protein PHQ96_04990 [Candidatus Omnitrophica bacterium]|nr:hypothetical protein [Candidatus Omnitrophota bacterium]
MEKIPQSYSKCYKALILYRDDLEQIAKIFNKNCKEYTIEADEYKLANISEISNINKPSIIDFKIYGSQPYMYLDINHFEARLYCANKDDEILLGIASKINSILTKRVSKIKKIISSNFMFIPILIIWFFGIWIFKNNLEVLKYSAIFYLIFSGLWFFFAGKLDNNIIYLFSSQSKNTFLKRNKDSIILLLLGGIIGIFFTIVTELIRKRLVR